MLLQEEISWLIPLLPFCVASFIALCLISFNRTMNRLSKPVFFLSASSLLIPAVISLLLTREFYGGEIVNETLFMNELHISGYSLLTGFFIDRLSTSTLSILTFTLLALVLTSNSFLFRKDGYVRFFIFLGLFSSSCLGLAVSVSLLELFSFWVLLGLFSYYLKDNWRKFYIGTNSNSNLFFTIDLLSNLLFLIAVYILYGITGSFDFENIKDVIHSRILSDTLSLSNSILLTTLFFGAIFARILETPCYILDKFSPGLPRDKSIFIYFFIVFIVCTFVFIRIEPILNEISLAYYPEGIFSIF